MISDSKLRKIIKKSKYKNILLKIISIVVTTLLMLFVIYISLNLYEEDVNHIMCINVIFMTVLLWFINLNYDVDDLTYEISFLKKIKNKNLKLIRKQILSKTISKNLKGKVYTLHLNNEDLLEVDKKAYKHYKEKQYINLVFFENGKQVIFVI